MKKLGYNAIQTYYNPKYWKTDAPPEVLYDVFKAYKIEMCGGDKEKIMANLKEGTVGWRIFQKPQIHKEVDFSFTQKKEEEKDPEISVLGKKNRTKKYFVNPTPNWGPKPRATGK